MLNELLPNLTDDVTSTKIVSGATIYRDRWSIPHICADNAYDAFFAQGFATAQDRLWQMDFDRLRCLGRSAEYLGSSALTEDALMRRRRFEHVSRADYLLCSGDAKTALDAYADGVNAFIDSGDPCRTSTNSWAQNPKGGNHGTASWSIRSGTAQRDRSNPSSGAPSWLPKSERSKPQNSPPATNKACT